MTAEPITVPEIHYDSHPSAAILPLIEGADLHHLAADIKKHGLLHGIVIHDGKILDGRNRFAACKLAGVKPWFTTWDNPRDLTPTEWVLSVNVMRRQMDASQRAAVAVNALPLLEAEAKERQRMGKAKLPDPETKGQAREKAAESMKVSPRYVSDAKKIKDQAPEVFAEVAAGNKTIQEAKREIAVKVNPQPEPLPKSSTEIINEQLSALSAGLYQDLLAELEAIEKKILVAIGDGLLTTKQVDWLAKTASGMPKHFQKAAAVHAADVPSRKIEP